MITYVDDLIVVCPTIEQMGKVENVFKPYFVMHDLGPINYYLGIEVSKDDHGNFELNQSTYITKIAADSGMKDAKPIKTPMEVTRHVKVAISNYDSR